MGTFCVEGNEIRQNGIMIARIRRPDCDRWEDVLRMEQDNMDKKGPESYRKYRDGDTLMQAGGFLYDSLYKLCG